MGASACCLTIAFFILRTVFAPRTSHTSKTPDTRSLGIDLGDVQMWKGHQARTCHTCSTEAQNGTTYCESLVAFHESLRRLHREYLSVFGNVTLSFGESLPGPALLSPKRKQ
jgi:hypothetical protein